MDDTPTVVVGIDWAKDEHQICVMEVGGSILFEVEVKHTAPAIHTLADRLLGLATGVPTRVIVGIEVPRGALVETLMERGFRVFALNPKQMDRFRDRHYPSGAKDDRRDALVIADSLRTDRKSFREVRIDDPLIVQLREFARVHDDLKEEGNRLGNRFREQLYRYFPQILTVSPAADEPWVLELLERAPTPEQARRLQTKTLAKLLKKHRIRRLDAAAVRDALQAPSLTTAAGTDTAASRHVKLLIPRIRLVQQQERQVQRELTGLLEQLSETDNPEGGEHRDAEILLSLPGVGIIVAATMLAEAYWALTERNYRALRAHAGVAPVTKASGKRKHSNQRGRGRRKPRVVRRQACNDRLANAVYHWSRVASQSDPRAKEHYAALRAKGHTHGRALRGVADSLMRMLVAMLRDETLYDDQRRIPARLRQAA